MINQEQFRRTMRQLASGVAVITTEWYGKSHAMTVTSFTSVSADPPLVLVCINSDSDADALLRRSGRFGISVLKNNQRALSQRFAGKPETRYSLEGVSARRCPGGAVVFNDCAAVLEATVVNSYSAGDHNIYIGRVDYAESDENGQPLIYYRGDYHQLAEPLSRPINSLSRG